jgi:hypothetical protein
MCYVGKFDLSYTTLTGFHTRERLQGLKTSDPEFWAQLTSNSREDTASNNQVFPEDEEMALEDSHFEDDSVLPCKALIAEVLQVGSSATLVRETDGDDMVADMEAESLEDREWEEKAQEEPESSKMGKGKRKKMVNQSYTSF